MKQTKYGKTATFPGNGWRRFDINKATKVDPNNIDNGSSDTGGQAGATTLKVNSAVDCRLLAQGMFWYMRIPQLSALDIATIGVILDFPDATAGSPATAQADKIYCSGGITSDPTAMATRAFAFGIEHAAVADVRSYQEQAASQALVTGAASARHFVGTILKPSDLTKKNGACHVVNNSGGFVGGSAHNAVSLAYASSSDPMYLFLFVGTSGVASFERRVQMFYQLSKGFRIT